MVYIHFYINLYVLISLTYIHLSCKRSLGVWAHMFLIKPPQFLSFSLWEIHVYHQLRISSFLLVGLPVFWNHTNVFLRILGPECFEIHKAFAEFSVMYRIIFYYVVLMKCHWFKKRQQKCDSEQEKTTEMWFRTKCVNITALDTSITIFS